MSTTNANTKVANMNIVDITQAKELLGIVIGRLIRGEAKTFINICLHGSPGLGKSAIVRQITEDYKANLIDLRLSAMQESDVLGIPYTFEGEMKFSTPEWWPDGSVPTVLFLDELKSAPPAVQTAAYRLILDRSIQNGKVLPDNVMIVAAGNLKEDRTGARDLLPAAANRFGMHLIIDKKSAAEPFLNYAIEHGLNRSLAGYLTWKKEAIYGEIGEDAFATPRSWEYVSELLSVPEIAANEGMRAIAIAGAVGTEAAISLNAYLENEGKLPDWERIRSGDKNYSYAIPRGDLGLEYAVATGLAFELLDALRDDEPDYVSNLAHGLVKQLGTDMKVVMFKTMKRDFQTSIKVLSNPALKGYWQEVSNLVNPPK